MNIFRLHERILKKKLLHAPYSVADTRYLALGLCGEAGEIANKVMKEWRDGVDLAKEIREEIADVRVFLELLAKCYGIEGDKLDAEVSRKIKIVIKRHGV